MRTRSGDRSTTASSGLCVQEVCEDGGNLAGVLLHDPVRGLDPAQSCVRNGLPQPLGVGRLLEWVVPPPQDQCLVLQSRQLARDGLGVFRVEAPECESASAGGLHRRLGSAKNQHGAILTRADRRCDPLPIHTRIFLISGRELSQLL